MTRESAGGFLVPAPPFRTSLFISLAIGEWRRKQNRMT